MWAITDLEAKEGQRIYFARKKIEESFRDLKSLIVFLKQKWVIPRAKQRFIINAAFATFLALVQYPVLTHV